VITKKWLWLVGALILIASFTTTYLYAFNDSGWEDFGIKLRSIYDSSDKSQVIVMLDDSPITKEDLELTKAHLSFSLKKKVSNNEALEKIKENIILRDEAQKRNIVASHDEALELIKHVQEQMEIASVDDPNSVKDFSDYCKGLGMTKEDFFKNKRVINAYQNSIVTGMLHQNLAQEWGYKQSDLTNPQKIKEFESKLNELISKRKKEMKLEVLQDYLNQDNLN